MSTTTLAKTSTPSRGLKAALWAAQAVLSLAYIAIGVIKLTTPIVKLAATMPWTGQLPEAFVRTIGIIDIAGGVGILLPALTRIQPRLTVAAALGCTVLQVLAIAFHTSRGETMVLPLNFVLITLSAFVLWGRVRKAPFLPR